MEKIKGTNTSVHVGCFTDDFKNSSWRDAQQIQKYSLLGVAAAVMSDRISCFFDLRRPSLTVNTACSSSLVPLALSCKSLWSRESNIVCKLLRFCSHAKAKVLTVSGNCCRLEHNTLTRSKYCVLEHEHDFTESRCYSFDKRANGFGRGEGFVALILKRLSSALQDGDVIPRLIRSTGINQDGGISGITEPSKKAQADLIIETYRKAGLDNSLTGYFKATNP